MFDSNSFDTNSISPDSFEFGIIETTHNIAPIDRVYLDSKEIRTVFDDPSDL